MIQKLHVINHNTTLKSRRAFIRTRPAYFCLLTSLRFAVDNFFEGKLGVYVCCLIRECNLD